MVTPINEYQSLFSMIVLYSIDIGYEYQYLSWSDPRKYGITKGECEKCQAKLL